MHRQPSPPPLRARSLRNNPTEAERALRQIPGSRGPEGIRFNRQVPIGPFICDFAARSLKRVIEVDGGQHDPEHDRHRTEALAPKGYRLVRFRNHDMPGNPEGGAERIREVIAHMPSPNPTRQREGSHCNGQIP
jgi:very-short-patch-repair endonuclease